LGNFSHTQGNYIKFFLTFKNSFFEKKPSIVRELRVWLLVTSGKLPETWQTNEDIRLRQERKAAKLLLMTNAFRSTVSYFLL
jgi:hypothetical protein